MKRPLLCWFAIALKTLGAIALAAVPPDELPLSSLKLPPGFQIELFARVPNARQMALGKTTLFVGSMRAGKIYGIPLNDPAKPVVIAEGLQMPVGVAFHGGDLYVSAASRILRLRDVEARMDKPPLPELVTQGFPADAHHGWKFTAFGPEGRLYVPVAAPCNICEPNQGRDATISQADTENGNVEIDARGLRNAYATITRLDVNSGKIEEVAHGVHNTVGFDWQPQTGELWFTDNGRDWLGDDAPPDELNRLSRPGQHFGYPYCHGGTIADPEFGQTRCCSEFVPPV
jgi:glucose/arabinose dehydrogenase